MSDITLEDFETEVRTFLDANAEKKPPREAFVWGQGSDDAALFEEIDREHEKVLLGHAKDWRAKRYDAGFGYLTGPSQFGGRELSQAHQRLYDMTENEYEVPDQGFFGIGLGMVAPTIKDHAQPEVAAEILPKMYRADWVGCQLFSEPGAGSDLASLQTKAERDGDEWVITGQKVWTSGAHYSDVGEVICRTDPNLPKHKGLTGFIVDMHDPAIEVVPLRQMTGGAAFNEVFFNEYRVPDAWRLGDENQGWSVALTTLMNERASIGGGSGGAATTKLIEMVRHFGLADDALTRQDLAQIWIQSNVNRYTHQRAMDKMKAGGLPGPEMSIGKLALTRNMTSTVEFVSKVLGARVQADTGEWGTYAWSKYVLGVPAMRIAGGADEILRNIVSERVLGMPKDVGIDTTSPFNELTVGTQTS